MDDGGNTTVFTLSLTKNQTDVSNDINIYNIEEQDSFLTEDDEEFITYENCDRT